MANKMKNRTGIHFSYDMDLEDKHMKKYVKYLEKRYGKKRANQFFKNVS